jgi:hypothetical protein
MINRIFFAILGLVFVILVFNRVKKKRFSEKESLFWMATAIMMLILSIFPQILTYVTNLINIVYPPSLLFLAAIMFLIIIVFRLTEQISVLQEHVKELAQNYSLLEERLRSSEIDNPNLKNLNE